MSNRTIKQEVQDIFNKYTKNFVKRLKKPQALAMFQAEYEMSPEEAEIMFVMFDKDQNGELSMWEFSQFYDAIGEDCKDHVKHFNTMEKDDCGCVDIMKVWEVMTTLKTASGRQLDENEIVLFLKSSAGEEKTIDFRKFINVICRVKTYKA